MSKSSTKIALPKVSGGSRRAQYSASTRRALIDTAEALFTAGGYAATSLDAIVSGTRVTKGALYHHFNGKQALFEAVFERVESETTRQIQKAIKAEKNPWDKAAAGLKAFLDAVQSPAYRRIVVQDGPAVLGYEKFREQEERSTFTIINDLVANLLDDEDWNLDEETKHTFSQICFGALSAAGDSVSSSVDPAAASARVEAVIGFLMSGLRSFVESGTGKSLAVQAATSSEGGAAAS